MRFFRIRHNQWETRRFAWAMSFGPLDGPMPFLHPVELELNRKSWDVDREPPGLIIEDADSKAKAWPDFLGHGGTGPSFFVSAKVIESLKEENIEFLRATQMPIACAKCSLLKNVPAPQYYALEAAPGIEIDQEASVGRPAPMFRQSSWTGRHLMGWPHRSNEPSTILLCTEKVAELARESGWTNVRFEKIHLI